ncbi:amidophosphoribosyltransferase [Candidatus Methylomirabilis lanthanidiphila]|uniref:asparagine synthase (glutamine-hydrolyzing) n=1 Tax=Candidatus Methylomirabilis lanthanidiphila TaxID=2211376 RepID=A0A564ZI32_9BACT|nr:amidophosphoribosyltransferase [Candidatus Methylomirabilis lanthanidiphila]
MLDPETGNRIVFNGEIYNYPQLRTELETFGYRFSSNSDTEVLLKLYAEYGQEMLTRLRGMYAFAIWDKTKRGIFLARDPFGIKPLYLVDDGNTLRFASQVKALLAGGQVDTTPEPAGHVGFFLWGHVPEPFTLYKNIRALRAGSCLWIDSSGRKDTGLFFELTAELREHGSERISQEYARKSLSAVLLDSIQHHLVADVPVGVFLSAGLDSSSVVALAAEVGSSALQTLTLGFKEYQDTPQDEVTIAESVARHYGTRHHTYWVQRDDFVADRDRLLDAMDQPSIDGVNTYFVAKAAHEMGLKVALSGTGGDELFGGYPDFVDIPRLVHTFRPFARVPGLGRGFRYLTAPLVKRLISPKYAGLFEYGGDWAGAYLLRRGLFMPWELPDVLDGELVRKGWSELHTLAAMHQSVESIGSDRLKVTALETGWYLRNQLLRDTDWASMAHSLEVRVPLVDLALFRAVTRWVHAGFIPTKHDMAACPTVPLPQSVRERPKTGFGIPVRQWLMADQNVNGMGQRGLRGWAGVVYRNAATRDATHA